MNSELHLTEQSSMSRILNEHKEKLAIDSDKAKLEQIKSYIKEKDTLI